MANTELRFSPGDIIAGRYEVCALLGRGGMGAVYLAMDKELRDSMVALKLLHPDIAQDPVEFERFRNEVLIARELSHPNIVRIHDLAKATEGFYYISMEYVTGESLKSYLNSHTALTFPELLTLYQQLLEGAAHAHHKGVIHRDLKPDNIIVSESGTVKLVDFGVSRLMEQTLHLTKTGHSVGTPVYMSPEQIRGEELDASSDVYALGIIGYQLVCGKPPFTATSFVEIAYKHIEHPLPDFLPGSVDVPDWFKDIIRKATTKKSGQRFANAAQMLQALQDHQEPELNATVLMPRPKKPRKGLWVSIALVLCGAGVALWMVLQPPTPRKTVAQVAPETAMPDQVKPLPAIEITEPEPEPEPMSVPKLKPIPVAEPAIPELVVKNDVQLFILKSGESTPRESYTLAEFSDLRWIAALKWDNSASDAAKQGQCQLRAINLNKQQIIATMPGSVFSQGSSSNRELRMAGDFAQQSPGSLIPGAYSLELFCNEQRLTQTQITLRP